MIESIENKVFDIKEERCPLNTLDLISLAEQFTQEIDIKT